MQDLTKIRKMLTIFRADGSSKHFSYLSEILHIVDRVDILHLYGWVTAYFESHETKDFGLILLGDLHMLYDSAYRKVKGFDVWKDHKSWKIVSWKYCPLPHVHMIYTLSGKVLYMWDDLAYPLTIGVLKQMLQVKLTVPYDMMGNDMTYAEQLVQSIMRSYNLKVEMSVKHGVHIENQFR